MPENGTLNRQLPHHRQVSERGFVRNPFSKIRDNPDPYIKDGNLVICLQQYELMPYAAGFPEFSIPMASLSSVLAPDMATRTWAPAK